MTKHSKIVRLVIQLPFSNLDNAPPPPQCRAEFVAEIRSAIMRAHLGDRIDAPVAEELWRAIPGPDPRR